jgi:hypothetical protein
MWFCKKEKYKEDVLPISYEKLQEIYNVEYSKHTAILDKIFINIEKLLPKTLEFIKSPTTYLTLKNLIEEVKNNTISYVPNPLFLPKLRSYIHLYNHSQENINDDSIAEYKYKAIYEAANLYREKEEVKQFHKNLDTLNDIFDKWTFSDMEETNDK